MRSWWEASITDWGSKVLSQRLMALIYSSVLPSQTREPISKDLPVLEGTTSPAAGLRLQMYRSSIRRERNKCISGSLKCLTKRNESLIRRCIDVLILKRHFYVFLWKYLISLPWEKKDNFIFSKQYTHTSFSPLINSKFTQNIYLRRWGFGVLGLPEQA